MVHSSGMIAGKQELSVKGDDAISESCCVNIWSYRPELFGRERGG